MKVVIRSFVILLALTSLATYGSSAQARPDRPTHEGDTGPGPTPSTPGDGGGSSTISYPDRPSRDVSHGDSSGDYEPSYGDAGGYVGGGGSIGIACAPSDIQSNVASTERTLTALAKSQDFQSAVKFQTVIAKISAIKDNSAKASAYMGLAGINAKDSKAVFEFVGAREARGTWIVELERNAGLSESQAVSVANSLQSALRGGLN
jgi:hypothetical protein